MGHNVCVCSVNMAFLLFLCYFQLQLQDVDSNGWYCILSVFMHVLISSSFPLRWAFTFIEPSFEYDCRLF